MIYRKRYILLVGDNFYPSGWDDYADSFDDPEEAIAAGQNRADEYSWFEVVDLETNKLIRRNDYSFD